MATPVLVIQHEIECPPGLVGDGLLLAGLELDIRHPYAGQPIPEQLSGFGGLVVLGGHMGADDDAEFPWLTTTKALVREAASTRIPTLGICLGHQLAASALGGMVQVNPNGYRRGVLDMGWSRYAATDPVLSGCGSSAIQWHHDVVVQAPPRTHVLASAVTGELLAARFAPTVWGVQCHPEADGGIVGVWASGDRRAAESTQEVAVVDAALRQVHDESVALATAWAPLSRDFAPLVR